MFARQTTIVLTIAIGVYSYNSTSEIDNYDLKVKRFL